MKIHTLCATIDSWLNSSAYVDSSLNGLQVESPQTEIRFVACAVDSGEMVIQEACKRGAQLLIVHHGLLWGALDRITGPMGRKVSLLMHAGCSLYASHLPLDGNLELGNGAELARFLGFNDIQNAFRYQGAFIGVTVSAEPSTTIESIAERAATLHGAITPLVIRVNAAPIRKIGIVTGSGAFAVDEAYRLGLDLLVSGEAKQDVFHRAHELGVNCLFLGHYATETLGVLALSRRIERDFGLETTFIDIPTGI
jgi:dinuclear metal center YbgI/SA1388 family protein